MKKVVWESLVVAFAMAVSANAFTLSGKVKDEQGAAVSGASVSMLQKGLETKTDNQGNFSLHQDEQGGGSEAILGRVLPGYISVNNGVLSFSQRSSEPVQVQIFDMVGNRLLSETLYGSGSLDLQACVRSQGTYYARVKIGSALRNIRFTSNGNFGASFEGRSAGVKNALKKEADSEVLRVIAEGFDTLDVELANLDTTLALTLKKTVVEPEYAYGWGLKNAPVPTRGCGKTWNRVKSGSYEFQWSKGKRTIRIDIPDNYDNKKPYKLIFGMHCMGGWAGGVQQEGYYGLKPLDTEKTAIFVAPEGNGQQAPWGQDDYLLFDELLADLQSNLCIDSSRVFSTGFSYGSMFSNGLSWNHQDVLRAVAVYETAERNIWLPQRQNKGIGWMGVLGLQDNLCTPAMGRAARDIILELNSEGGKAKNERAQEYGGNGPTCATTIRLSKNSSRFAGAHRTVAISGTTRIRARTSLGCRRPLGTSSISSKSFL